MPDYGHALEFGVFPTPAAQAADAVVELAALADQLGLDLVTIQDHPYQARFLDTWTLLSFVAARTSRVRLAPNVLNLPLRPPAVVARAAASLDVLSGGRFELGIGAGAFWDGVAGLGGPRRTPGESVDALREAIGVLRALWDADTAGRATLDGRYYPLAGAARGPAPAHPIQIWVGAYKPRMLRLTGQLADGWLPSLPYLQEGDLAAGNAAIDAAARAAGREPTEIRRLLNLGGPQDGSLEAWIEELVRFALDDGVGTFIVMTDDPGTLQAFASEVAPAVREQVAAARAGDRPRARGIGRARPRSPRSPRRHRVRAPRRDADARRRTTAERADGLGRVDPAAADAVRRGAHLQPPRAARRQAPDRRPRHAPNRARAAARHRRPGARRRDHRRRGPLGAERDGAAPERLDARRVLLPLLRRRRPASRARGRRDLPPPGPERPEPRPVIDRLADEHLVIHDAIQAIDRALVEHINHPEDYEPIQAAIDFLTDALLSHLSYEEHQIVEPLARLGFYPGQV